MERQRAKAHTLELLGMAGVSVPDDELDYLVDGFEQSRLHAARVRGMTQTRYDEPATVLTVGEVR